MRLLVDSHVLIWALTDYARLSPAALKALTDPGTERFLSAATLWEIGIKSSIGKLKLPVGLDKLLEILPDKGLHLNPLPVDWRHSVAASTLAQHHKDPFDRMLIAQAKTENMAILTSDRVFKAYKVKTVW